jgi:hypothetical protein
MVYKDEMCRVGLQESVTMADQSTGTQCLLVDKTDAEMQRVLSLYCHLTQRIQNKWPSLPVRALVVDLVPPLQANPGLAISAIQSNPHSIVKGEPHTSP